MADPRIYLDQPLAGGSEVLLPEDAARHLVQVLRMQAGDSFVAFNGQGGEYHAALSAVAKREVRATIGELRNVNRESPLQVTLAQCVSKGDRMDYTLQKAVELGVSSIVPLLSSRSVVRMDAERWQKKLEHWRGVIIGACEQSGRTRVPELQPVAELANWLQESDRKSLRLTLAPESPYNLRETRNDGRSVTLLVGPEGGLSPEEIVAAERQGFLTVKLGPRVLRTETAGVVCLANIQSLWGDLC